MTDPTTSERQELRRCIEEMNAILTNVTMASYAVATARNAARRYSPAMETALWRIHDQLLSVMRDAYDLGTDAAHKAGLPTDYDELSAKDVAAIKARVERLMERPE